MDRETAEARNDFSEVMAEKLDELDQSRDEVYFEDEDE